MLRDKTKFFLLIVIIIFGASLSLSQVTDIDGNAYKTVIIGNQEWMAENLKVEHYRNGDPIPRVQDQRDWSKLITSAWCYYENDATNGIIYGNLYNWFVVNDTRGLAPEGWHVPSANEWNILIDYLGGWEVAGSKLKAKTLWDSPNKGATNKTGFTGLPGGLLYSGYFQGIGFITYYWSSTEYGSFKAYLYTLSSFSTAMDEWPESQRLGISVRCIKD